MTDYTDALDEIATRVFEDRVDETPPPTINAYPDCWKLCTTVLTHLEEQTSIPISSSRIEEIILGDEYRHYVVVVCTGDTGTYVVDSTFGQFSNEYESPVNVGSLSEVSHVIVQRKSDYIFTPQLSRASSK